MPRNAAKKTNKNAKRLPVLIKLLNRNINNKKKKVNSKKNNNKNSSSCNIDNKIKNLNAAKQKKKHKQTKTKKAFVNATFTRSNKINKDNNCDANITISTTTDTLLIENPFGSLDNLKPQNTQDLQENVLNPFLKTQQCFNSEKETVKELQLKVENNLNISITSTNITEKLSCETEIATTNFTFTSSLVTDTATSESASSLLSSSSSSLPFLSSSLNSPNSSVSSLYPIVIETSDTFLQHNDDIDKEQQQQERNENSLNTKKKKIHSIYNCRNNSNHNSNNNSNNNNKNITNTCCHTAVDTLKQYNTKSQNNTNSNNNNNNNSTSTTSFKRNNNNNKQKTATKVLITSSETSNQSQEVKARLATLRTRRKVSSQQANVKAAQKGHKTVCSAVAEPTRENNIEVGETKDVNRAHGVERQLIRKVSPVIDYATLNLIETLSDEAKKSNNKRKRNSTTAVLLGLATLHQPRSKRITANYPSLPLPIATNKPYKSVAGTTSTVLDKNEAKTTCGNFLKPLPVEATNTNSKKRARIMSLYERPFQTTNDGRGSVVPNGYMTSSRTSVSSGGGSGGGAMVLNDTSDTQEIANQYYMSGSSGSGIAGSSNSSLVGNGGAINLAPTMGTLCNIGNTCYLNSVVYTLRFAPQFLHNLHHLLADLNALQQNIARARAKSSSLGRGINAVHMENARSWSSKDLASMEQYNSGAVAVPTSVVATNSTALTQVTQKSCHQLLTEKLHELYQSLHRNEINESTEPHHADTLLHAIQDVSSIFEGNQQQDAHEFLMCLLNSIRETSQTLIKAIAECPDVILNGYISNPDEIERDLLKPHSTGGIGGIIAGSGGNSKNTNSLATAASSKPPSFFSRKSKRKDESKNSKNSRLQSPLKDALMTGNTQTTTTANSLFYLNTNDLNSTTAVPASATGTAAGKFSDVGCLTSPSSSSTHVATGALMDETDAPTSVALILKDKQRFEGRIRELGLDFFNEDFEGITVSSTKCLSCETITEQKETMIDIAVPVPQAGYESNEVMNRPSSFIQNSCITREYFRNENKYRCEQCCGYTEAIRSISYEVLPRLLIIQLSRFSGGMEKINSYIPTSFTLQCFCSKCCELSDANKLHIYKLYSVITHVGATMSVGHYIAYTCSLDWANEYINCPKEQRRRASQERSLGTTGNSTSLGNSTQSSAASSGLGTSSSFMKMKMKFGRSKASSSGDMSKNVKQLNGLNSNSSSSKCITNGIGKLSMNSSAVSGGITANSQCPITCQSINCCAMRLTAQQQLQYQSANNSTSDFSEESSQYSNGSGYNTPANYNNNIHNHPYSTSNNTSGYGSTGRGSTKASYATTQNNCSEPIWYMCDDDKIKAMTQREFEELLSPARKITITPYLLFYARYNLQTTPPKSANVSSSSPGPGPVTSSPHTSWSNESLQSSGQSAHSSGMRM